MVQWNPKARQKTIERFLHGTPKRKIKNRPEQDFQRNLVTELRWRTIAPARFWHVPNGGARGGKEAAILVGIGVTPGVSDLHFAWVARHAHPTLENVRLIVPRFGVMELKAHARDKPTDAQRCFLDDMDACGHESAVCASVEDALDVLAAWGFPLRAAR